jgi:membrane associated rhomboid family serine protease
MVKALMITCVAVWIGQQVFGWVFNGNLALLLGLVPALVLRGYVWQLVTYIFLHAGIGHILFNMLFLWMLGGELERVWGSRAFLRYWLVTGTGAGVLTVLLSLFAGGMGIPTIGASGAIFGLVAAYGMLFGERTILFMMMFPMKARTFAWLMAAIAFFGTVSPGGSNVAHVAHLGGAITGFLYLKRAWRVRPLLQEIRWKLRRRRFRVMDRDDDYPFH